MKVLILGANGFIGKQVRRQLALSHEVWGGTLEPAQTNDIKVDLLNKRMIEQVLSKLSPKAIINCAGVVENSNKAKMNVRFTSNLLETVDKMGLSFSRIIICGSAAEYGNVDDENKAVNEETPLRATSAYGLSKLEESRLALKYRQGKQWPIVVARIFNPIGIGMHPRLIIPGILSQINAIQNGTKKQIEISRLDSKRDYIDVRDIANAMQLLIEKPTPHAVYNLGSGTSTTNQKLIDLLVKYSNLVKPPKIVEVERHAETPVAAKADIHRIQQDLNWSPKIALNDAIKEIIHATRRT